jgi:hypothetical protein
MDGQSKLVEAIFNNDVDCVLPTVVLDFIDFCRGGNDPVVELESLLPIDGGYNLLNKRN